MSSTTKLLRPPEDVYSDEVLYGPRREATRLIEFAKANNNPDCIIRTSKDTIVDKQQWSIKNLIGSDKRIKTMVDSLGVTHALSIQRYCWPQIHYSAFPFVCISPKSSGKTFTHLFYIVTQCISDTPMAKTNELLSESEQLGSFTCSVNGNGDDRSENVQIDVNNIDPNEFDFDSFDSNMKRKDNNPPTSEHDGDNREPMIASSNQVNVDDYIKHPKYIILCSSQNHVETLSREVDRMKVAAFGAKISDGTRTKLPPTVATIHVHQDPVKMITKFDSSEVLIATPGAFIKCMDNNLVDFNKCRRLFFDDIDLSLQLHNRSIREIIKLFVVQLHEIEQQAESSHGLNGRSLESCKIHMFSRKWTDLLKQSINTVFRQHVLIFGSIAEASIYGSLRYEVEYATTEDLAFAKLKATVERYESTRKSADIMAIACRTNTQSRQILKMLDNRDQNKAIVLETDSVLSLKLGKSAKGPVYIVSDSALEFTIGELNDVTHLVHFTLPDEIIMFDQRFRLMYRHLISSESTGMSTSVFLTPETSNEFVKELYDIVSRSTTTLRSTKLELKDLMGEKSTEICWRWASTGLCRLEKLSKDDRFGSYCPDRHSFLPTSSAHYQDNRWPKNGQVRITITHLVNPNEFYFWFEAHRDIESHKRRWRKFERSGTDFMRSIQAKLDELKGIPSCSVPLASFNKEQVYGVYFHQEARVDRVVILDNLNFDHLECHRKQKNGKIPLHFRLRYNAEYSNQIEVLKIDYGTKVNVYMRNVFALPDELASIERQCYRGFHLGVKPTDNEPDWLYKAKKNFFDLVCVDNLQDVTAWLRTQSGRCFWFDNMIVYRELPEIGTKGSLKTFPHDELVKKGLALKCNDEPTCLPASDRLETLCKWRTDDVAPFARRAFLRRDKDANNIFVLHVVGRGCLDLKVRLADFNNQLMQLEHKIHQDYQSKQLEKLNYFAEGVYCIVRFRLGHNDNDGQPQYEFNRCIIKRIIAGKAQIDPDSTSDDLVIQDDMYCVECLDHGEEILVKKSELFLAKADYLKVLPFQTIWCTLADLNPEIFADYDLVHSIKELLYDLTRTETNDLKVVKSRLKGEKNELYLYLPTDATGVYVPLIALYEQAGISICDNDDPELRKFVEFKEAAGEDDEPLMSGSASENIMKLLITSLLDDIIMSELNRATIKIQNEKEEKEEEALADNFTDISP